MPTNSNKYLRPADLAALRYLTFSPRRPTEGRYAGRHQSVQRGHSVEFNDYRQYMPGDEPGDIDWKIFGRSDRLYIKIFEHVSDMTVQLLIDGSASMGYAGCEERPRKLPDSKYDHAARLAASIAFLVAKQQDRVGFAVARNGLRHTLEPTGGMHQTNRICESLARVQLGERAELAEALDQLARRWRRRGLLIVLSDLLDPPDAILEKLQLFLTRGSEVIVFHVMHEDELDLPDIDSAVLTDSETNDRLSLNVPDIRKSYAERIQLFVETWRSELTARGIDYNLVSTGDHHAKALEHYLVKRGAKA